MRLSVAALAVLIAAHAAAGPLMGGRRRVTPPAPDVVFRLMVPVATTGTITEAKGRTLTFARASAATCATSSSAVTSLTSGQPCLASGGVGLEPTVANYEPDSETQGHGGTVSGSYTGANTVVAPDGTTTGDVFTSSGSNARNYDVSLATSAGEVWTASVWVRAQSGTGKASVTIYDGVGDACTNTDVATTTTWQRISTSCVVTSGRDVGIVVYPVGPKTSNTTGATGVIWGRMLEKSAASAATNPTSYFKTAGGSGTRAAETLTTATTGWPTSEGSFSGTITLNNATPTQSLYVLDSHSASAGGYLMYVDSAGNLHCGTSDGSVTRAAQTESLSWTVGVSYRVRCAFIGSNVYEYRDDALIASTTNSNGIPAGHASTAYVGSNYSGTNQLQGTIRNLCISSRLGGCP